MDRYIDKKEIGVWWNIVGPLLFMPITLFIVALILGIGGIFGMIMDEGPWWVLIMAYIISGCYLWTLEARRRERQRKAIPDALVLYFRDQLVKQGRFDSLEICSVRGEIVRRIEIWKYSNPEMWAKVFPCEKYSESLFGIVDNLNTRHETKNESIKRLQNNKKRAIKKDLCSVKEVQSDESARKKSAARKRLVEKHLPALLVEARERGLKVKELLEQLGDLKGGRNFSKEEIDYVLKLVDLMENSEDRI